jgi:hypothetical protein
MHSPHRRVGPAQVKIGTAPPARPAEYQFQSATLPAAQRTRSFHCDHHKILRKCSGPSAFKYKLLSVHVWPTPLARSFVRPASRVQSYHCSDTQTNGEWWVVVAGGRGCATGLHAWTQRCRRGRCMMQSPCAWASMHCATPYASDVCMIKSYEHTTNLSDVSHRLGSVHGLATLHAPTARTQQTAREPGP